MNEQYILNGPLKIVSFTDRRCKYESPCDKGMAAKICFGVANGFCTFATSKEQKKQYSLYNIK